jgi:predicted GIY-YIG superfamily endonuclease
MRVEKKALFLYKGLSQNLRERRKRHETGNYSSRS